MAKCEGNHGMAGTVVGKQHLNIKSASETSLEFVLCAMDFLLRKILTVNVHIKIGLYVAIILLSSFLGNNDANSFYRGSILNQYFVKLGWGWTFCMVGAFIVLSSLIQQREWDVSMKPLQRLLLATVYWYICTSLFELLEQLTGSCSTSSEPSKRLCLKQGFVWSGFDISGHCFLLIHCLLFMNEELRPIHTVVKALDANEKAAISSQSDLKTVRWYKLLLRVVTVCLVFLNCLWEVMLLITSLYFHSLEQKVCGTFFGILGWFMMYRIVKL